MEEEKDIEKQESAEERPQEPSSEAEGTLEISKPQEKSPDWLRIILFTLLGILVLGGITYGGYWYATTLQTTTRKPASPAGGPQFGKPKTTPSPTPAQPSPTPSIEEQTKNWKTYKSSAMKFSVKYPAGWEAFPEKLVAGGTVWSIRTDKKEDISVNFRYGVYYEQVTKGKVLTFQEIISKKRNELSADFLMEEESIVVADRTATKFTYNPKRAKLITEPDLVNYEIYFPLEGEENIFDIRAVIRPSKQEIYDPIFDLMLQTFRFTD